jgi:ElaB/YqjD/DUF883 family membrane-anchored ribosome-binding protein
MAAAHEAKSEYNEIKRDLKDVKNEAKDRFADDIDSLKESFSQLKDDLHKMFDDAVGTGRAGARVMGDHANQVYGSVKDQAQDAYIRARKNARDLKDRGADQVDMLGEKIAENPLTAAAIAFGVGFIISRLMSRR